MTKQMEAKGNELNGWGNLYCFNAIVKWAKALVQVKVPLSSNIFQTNADPQLVLLLKLLGSREHKRQQVRKRNEIFKALPWPTPPLPPAGGWSKYSAMGTGHDADIDNRSRWTKGSARGNPATREVDADWAAAKSAKQSRNQSAKRNLTETYWNAASEAREGKRNRWIRSGCWRNDERLPRSAPTSAIESDYKARKSGITPNQNKCTNMSRYNTTIPCLVIFIAYYGWFFPKLQNDQN